MLLRPRNKKELVGQISALPARKRRVVVLIGRHPNEGTINIGVHNHKQWEKHGAVTVWLPPHWTPQGFWHRVKRRPLSNRALDSARRTAKQLPGDEKLVTMIGQSIGAPVINFHGTDAKTPSLNVYYHSKAPQWLVKALQRATRRSNKDVVLQAPHRRKSDPDHPLEVLVENYYAARKAGEKTRQRRKQKNAFLNRLFRIENRQLDADYLTYPGITRQGLSSFRKRFSRRLDIIIRELAQTQNRRKK